MIIQVPTSALPHLRPALRLADPAQPVISLQGRRTPGAATRGRRAAPDPSAASARLGRPGGDGRADPAPAGKAASAGWSHPAPSCGGTIAWSPGRHGQAAAEMTSLAISVRELSTPCHLAHGLLDYAQYLTRTRDAEGAAAAIKEARAIAGRLRCQPLLDRAADIAPAKSVVQDQVAAVPDLEEPTGPAGVTPAAAPRLRRTGHVQNDPYGPRIWPRASRSLGYRTAGRRAGATAT
jgi:hypothetical protein